MTRLGSFQGDFSSFVVTHFADQNYLRCLSQSGSERRRKILRIVADLPLIDGRILVRVQVFDRIFDCDDVIVLRLVDDVDYSSKRRAFTGAGGTGDENETVS